MNDASDDPTQAQDDRRPPSLDDLQRSILRHAAHGRTAAQIARDLAVSEATMRRALHRARLALGAKSTTHAVYLAAKEGLI